MMRSVKRVLTAQAALAAALVTVVAVVTAAVGMVSGGVGMLTAVTTGGVTDAVTATTVGAFIGMLTTVVTARSVLQSAHAASAHPHLALLPVFAGLLLKLLIVAGGVFAAMIYLKLGALYLMLGYITMQAGYFFAGDGDDQPTFN